MNITVNVGFALETLHVKIRLDQYQSVSQATTVRCLKLNYKE